MTNNRKTNVNASGSIGFTGLLTVAFVVLKLCKVIAWSWLWVLSPIWIPIGLFIVAGLIYFVYLLATNKK